MSGGRLEGVGIVITRPRPAAEALAAALAREGAVPFIFPAIAIEALPPSSAQEAALARLASASLAVFVSANAVEHGLAAARRRGPWPAGVAVAAIGDATARALRNSGFARVISPHERHDTEALAGLPELQGERLRGENVVVFRGEGGRERLKQILEERGARVTYVESYRRVRPEADARGLLAAWDRGEIHAVSALSGETIESFVALLGDEGPARLARATLVVPHEAVAAHRHARRFARVIVAEPGAEGIAKALTDLKVAG